METVQETINRIREQSNSNILHELKGIDWGNNPEDTIAAIKSAPVQEAIAAQANGGSLAGDTLGAFGIGVANMLNNTVLGGTALGLGNLGRVTEAISPFSGWDNDTLAHLANLGLTPDEAYQISPYRDSWLTSMGKGTLAVHNAIDDTLKDARTQVIGNNPSFLARGMEGFGSNIGFLLSALLFGSNPLTAALASGGLESISEAGGMLADAYRNGQYDNGAIGAANKSFLANLVLNTGLDYALGPFGKATEGIKNPITRYLASGLTEILNEEFQEPSQEVIEQAAMNSLNNGTGFLPELGQSIKQWPETFTQLAPEVAFSTLLSVLAGGAGAVATRKGRHNLAKQSVLGRYDTVTNPNGEQQLRTHQPNMDLLRQSFADDLSTQKTSLEDIINGIYQTGNDELDTNPDMISDVQRNSAKLKTVNQQLEAISNFGKQAQIQQTIDDVQNTLADKQANTQQANSQQKTTDENLQEETPPVQEVKKPKKSRKQKNTITQDNSTSEQDTENISEQDEEPDNLYLSSNEDQENELTHEELTEREAKTPENKPAQGKEDLPEFTPTEDTVNAYKAKNVAGSNTARVRTIKGTEVDVRYKIVDADDLIASTTDTGAPNKKYLQALQPRDRGKLYSIEQIYRIAAKPDPELLGANRMASDGAPIIGADMMVESGNGRVLALRKAYKDNTAENYRTYLRDNAELFGLTADDVDSVTKPVLVRERITALSDADRINFTSEANESSVATMSASEHALDDAKKITSGVLSSYDTELSFEANRKFIKNVIDLLPDNERANLIQGDGNISQNGLDRVRNALAAKAYRSSSILSRLSEVLDDEVKNISNALIQAAPKLAILETHIDKGNKRKDLSLRKDIMKAVNIFVNLRKQKKRVSDYLAQPVLFEEEADPQAVRMLLEFFDKNIRAFKRMSNGLIRYADIALNQADVREQVFFEDSVRTKEDIIEEAFRRAVDEDTDTADTKKSKTKKKSADDNVTSPTRDDIYNSNFKRWFGDWEKHPKKSSKVVDENGRPLIVYHGTDAQSEDGQPPFTEFDTKGTSNGMHGNTENTGAWFHSSKKAAQSYGNYVYEVYLNIRNPYIYDCSGKKVKTIAKKKDQIVRDVRAGKYGKGYDGVIFRNIEDVRLYFGFEADEEVKGDVYIAFDKKQVKSATKNNGLYGQATGNIFKQSGNPNISAKEEQLRQDFRQKLIDAHRPVDEAEQLSHIYIAGNRYFSRYTGIPIDKLVQADNLSIDTVQNIEGNENIRGRTLFFREKKDIFDTIAQEAKTILQLTNNADKSSALHETGHIFLDKFRRLAASGMLKGRANQDWNTLVKALGLQDIDFSKPLSAHEKQILSDAHEQFATSLEKYLMTGKAPSSKLKHVFESFKRWLTDIYQSIRSIMYEGSDGELHTFDLKPEVRKVFDSMLGVDSSADGSISNDESMISPDELEQYNQRTYYSSGQPLKDNKFDFQDMRRSETGSLLNDGPAWGITTTETRFQAHERRKHNKNFKERGRIHFLTRNGDDAHEALRRFKDKKSREALEWVITDLEKRVDKDTTPEEFSAIKDNLLETYRRAGVGAADKIHYIKMIHHMSVDKDTDGSLYLVDTPNDDLLLDGDLPLAKQSEHVRRAIIGIQGQLKIWGVSLWSGDLRKKTPPRQRDLFSNNTAAWNASMVLDKNGLEFYKALARAMDTVISRTSTKITSPKFGTIENGRMAASIILNRFGIPGLRVKQKGFNVYTTWNEDMLKVLGVSKDSDNETVQEFERQEKAQERQKRKEQLALGKPSAVERLVGKEGLLQQGQVNINLFGGDKGTAPSKHRVTLDMENESYNQSSTSGQAATNADEVFSPEAQKQVDEVREQFEGSEQWLKAPNGKTSNLFVSDNTWMQVRTPNFKQWFGDWENDPEHASKILDDNGEPLILDHNTDDEFSVFDTEREGAGIDDAETPNGIFMKKGFDDEPFYRANHMFLFANIRNPFIVQNRDEVREKLKDYPPYTEALKEYKAAEKIYEKSLENAEPKELDNGTNETVNEAQRNFYAATKKAKRILRQWLNDNGYDGMIMKDDFGLYTVIALDKGQVKHAIGNNGDFSENPDVYKQAAYSPRDFMRKIIDKVASSAKKIFHPAVQSTPNTSSENIRFANEETERRYTESMKGVQQLGLLGRIKHSTMSLIRSMKGDFPELSGDALKFAKEQFRMLQRKKSSQVKQAMSSFTENLRGLDNYQRDLFGRKRLLDDLRWRKQNYPDAELPFGFTDDMLKKEAQRFDKLVAQDSAVTRAIQAEENTMRDISNEFIAQAKELGLNLEGVLRNPHYYRHTVLEYANAAAMGMPRSVQKSNASLQDFIDSQLRGVTGRGYLKRYKGSPLDISTNYVQANGEVRAQMLMDIEVMKALAEIKKKYDIAPRLRQKLKKAFGQSLEPETHNQPSTDDQTISDIIPDGYTLYDPAGSRLIQSANSSAENIISMAVDDAARQSGLPLDRLLRSLGSMGEDAINRLLVIPNEIANALDNMSKTRDRGMLGNAAKLLTNWWKKAVLFSPTRNIKYNFRNFTGDLDALIAGNPKALKFFPQAVKELTAHYRGKNTTQDLQDYIDRSGGLNVDSMQITPNEANAIYELAEHEPASLGKRGWNLIKKFFHNEVAFTAWRENLLRYAAYLAYKQDMEANNGTPSSWGASLKDEVLSLDDVRDKAYKMSNELLGAYDQVSEFGKQLRDLMIPFWSWSEINLKRYYRLLKNGLTGQNSSDFAKRFMLAKTARVPFYAISAAETFAKISLFTMLTQMFNRFIMPDDDDELPPDIKNKPHITLGKSKGQVYYFDRIGALGDAAEWLGLDNIVMDSKQLQKGSLTWADFMKKVITAPAGKILQEVNPLFRMPYELATGRTIYPDVSHPRMIRDKGAYISQTFGLSWPYKAATGKPRSDWDEFKNMFVYSADAEEAAYFYSLDMVRQFQERVLGKRFDGFAQTKRGQVLQKLKAALRFNDRQAIRQCLREYSALDGTKQSLKASMKSMNPLYGLTQDEKKKFLKWISQDDRLYLRKADKYYHHLADKYIR